LFFFKNSFFKKISEITCADGIAVLTAHHGRQPIAVPTVIWPVTTSSYANGDVPTVAIGTDYANGIFSCADLVCVS
jgi:hypothetical protein